MRRIIPFPEFLDKPGRTLMPRWRLLTTTPLDGAMNMAVDVALMRRACATGESVFRVYEWSGPTLSLGRNQTAKGAYHTDRLAALKTDVVRRPTGGRAILHWREVTYSVTAPANALPSLAESYARINEVLLAGVRGLGVAAGIAVPGSSSRHPDARPCFAEPSSGEIVLSAGAGAGSKLVASAQYREGDAILQHGSILLEDDQRLLEDLTRGRVASPRAATLNGALSRTVSFAEVSAVLFGAVRDLLDRDASVLEPESSLSAAAAYAPMFRDPLWTWRR